MGTEQRYLCTYDKLVPLCKIVCCNSRVYWFYDAEIQMGIGKTEWFKVFPFAIVAINILIAVVSDFESGIRGFMAMKEFGDRWWLSSENVWLYGGWWNWVNGIAGILNIFCMTGWWESTHQET